MANAVFLLILMTLGLCYHNVRASACPAGCYCNQRTVDCTTQMEFPRELDMDTESIRMSHLNIRDLPPRAFSRYPNLTKVEIINSNIANIQGCAFSEMPSIDEIIFDKTVIGNVENYAFMGLENITLFQFKASRIGRLKEFAIYLVSNIEQFLFFKVNIQNFYTHALYNLTDVNMMVWTQNNISDFVTGSLQHVRDVKQLEVTSNSFWNMHCGVMAEMEAIADKLIFMQNTFYCNCSAYWLLNDTGRTDFSWLLPKTRCHGPEALADRPSLNDVTFKELGCRSIESLTPTSCPAHNLTPQPACPIPGPWSTWVTQPSYINKDNKGDNSSPPSLTPVLILQFLSVAVLLLL